jgi:hypothetical protein
MPRVITPEIVLRPPSRKNTPMGAPRGLRDRGSACAPQALLRGRTAWADAQGVSLCFAMGVVGGVVGAKLLKGTLGLAIGAGLAYYAWSSLQPPPEMKLKNGASRRAQGPREGRCPRRPVCREFDMAALGQGGLSRIGTNSNPLVPRRRGQSDGRRDVHAQPRQKRPSALPSVTSTGTS